MNLTYKYLKNKYLSFFNYDIEYLNFVVTDALFGYSQISKYLKDKKIKKVCEVGSGTGILLNELQNKYPKKKFVNINNPKNLEKVTRIFFNQRRKMLKKPFNQLFNGDQRVLNKLKINLNLRPQNINLETYYKLAYEYENLRS